MVSNLVSQESAEISFFGMYAVSRCFALLFHCFFFFSQENKGTSTFINEFHLVFR